MRYEPKSDKQIDADVRSAGQSFLGYWFEDLLLRIPELDDRLKKSKLVEEYYENQQGYYDKGIGGTRTRVNSAVRIIKANKVEYALEKIDGSNPLVNEESVERAKSLLSRIRNGQFALPELS